MVPSAADRDRPTGHDAPTGLTLHRLREALHAPELASSAGGNPALPEDEMAAVLDRAGVPA
ncbi:hypothetical protein [Streptomyces cyaneofuscatus]|uniref:hypothetical protein n=1 Tax=Streptomyces cyaneofuscatus TaxID=66883 RepID=UPI0033A7DF71